MEKTVIRTEAAPAPFQGAPYNQAIRVGELDVETRRRSEQDDELVKEGHTRSHSRRADPARGHLRPGVRHQISARSIDAPSARNRSSIRS